MSFRPATQYDTDAVYALICELKQAEFDHHAFRVGFNANLRDPNMRYHLALLDGEVVGMIGLHLQFHLHHVNWIGEIQELVVMPQARGLNVAVSYWRGRRRSPPGRGRNDRTFDQREAPRRAPFLSARRLRAEPLPLHQGAVT